MTELYLVRHGQSMGNLDRSFLGHTDLDLTPMGYQQAEKTAAHLSDVPFDAIYSSDLLRAYHTAVPLGRERGIEVVPLQGLREIYAGEWEGQTFEVLRRDYTDSYATFRGDLGHARPDGGESTAELGDRVFACISRLVKGHEGEKIAIVSHATAICMFVSRVLGLGPCDVRRLALPPNASTTRVRWDGERFQLLAYGEDAYLGDLRSLAPPAP